MRLVPILLVLTLGLAACGPKEQPPVEPQIPVEYQARVDTGPSGEPIDIAAVQPQLLRERNVRQTVAYNGPEAPGTIVVDPYARFLYYVQPGGVAQRYGVAVGTAGKNFSGEATIRRKESWPSWTPTQNMIRTMPELYADLAGGKPGGLDNPLGARALYLYRGGNDTMYRIHGTMDPSAIGRATSAGCIRLFQQDIMDLFPQVPMGTHVKVRTPAESRALEPETSEDSNGYLIPAGQAIAADTPVAATPDEPALIGSVMDTQSGAPVRVDYYAGSPVQSALR